VNEASPEWYEHCMLRELPIVDTINYQTLTKLCLILTEKYVHKPRWVACNGLAQFSYMLVTNVKEEEHEHYMLAHLVGHFGIPREQREHLLACFYVHLPIQMILIVTDLPSLHFVTFSNVIQ